MLFRDPVLHVARITGALLAVTLPSTLAVLGFGPKHGLRRLAHSVLHV